jgi:glycosyltransferase involved in cell wall biosynthesis
VDGHPLARRVYPRGARPRRRFCGFRGWRHTSAGEIVVELARRIPEAQFWIIGSAAGEHPEVHEQLQRDALELANLNLLEPRPRAELAALYDRAVAVSNTSDFEGMSNILLEAWARGVPALVYSHDVGHRRGGIRDSVSAPRRLAMPDVSVPTSPALARFAYPRAQDIVALAGEMLDVRERVSALAPLPEPAHLDQPDPSFVGPF